MKPYEQWPIFAKFMCRHRSPGDKGVGDTVENYANKVGGKQFQTLSDKLGIPCGCPGRKMRLNKKYPYPKDISPDAPNCYLPPIADN